jgi:hypothetical protein
MSRPLPSEVLQGCNPSIASGGHADVSRIKPSGA